MVETTLVEVSRIIRESRYQVRQRIDCATVSKYADVLRSGVTLPPIQIAKVGDSLFLTDGWHRLAALELIGRAETVEAEVTETTAREVGWLAAKANLHHGLPLTKRDQRNVFRAYISARKHISGKRFASYREMARELGGQSGHATIRRWMMIDHPDTYRRMGQLDGNASGGQRERLPNAEAWTAGAIRDLNNARARFDGNTADAQGRGEVREYLKTMLRGMEQATAGEQWEKPEF
jgi:hypothetical protein